MPQRYRRLRTRHKRTFTVTYWKDRVTGQVVAETASRTG